MVGDTLAVGFHDLEIPLPEAERRQVGDALLKETGEPALVVRPARALSPTRAPFHGPALARLLTHTISRSSSQLESVLFTLYYPTARQSSWFPSWHHTHPHWLNATPSQAALGYAAFAKKSPWIIGGLTRIIGGRLKLSAWLGGELAQVQGGTASSEPVAVAGKPEMSERRRSVQSTREASGSGDTLVGASADKSDALKAALGGAATGSSFPVVIFSHGLAGNRTTYSQYCGDLASQGYIVAAIEHRDGSAPVTVVGGAQGRLITYLAPEAVESPKGAPALTAMAWRSQQLLLRLAEVKATLDVLTRINEGEGEKVEGENEREGAHGKGAMPIHLARWAGRLGMGKELTMAGHSFGGATTLQVLRAGRDEFDFSRGIALDPWAEPIPAPTARATGSSRNQGNKKNEGDVPVDIDVPVLVLNSEQFTLWSSHFATVRKLVRNIAPHPAWLLTMVGSAHMSFSDFPLLTWLFTKPKPSRVNPMKAMASFGDVTLEFLRRTDGPPEDIGRHGGGVLGREIDGDGGVGKGELERRVLDGTPGDWRVHSRPQ